jgi:hypothetical protein
MTMEERIIEKQLVCVPMKCSFFGKKEFVYFYVNYSSECNWSVSIDTPHYDNQCQCYEKNLEKLCAKEVEEAKAAIISRIKMRHSFQQAVEKKTTRDPARSLEYRIPPPPSVFKKKDIQIKDVDWRD